MSAHLLSLASLFAVSLATAAVPGPSIFYVMRLSMRRGRRAGMAAALGTTAGCILWCLAAFLGLAALLAAAPWLYTALRIAGGLYLIWFAVQLWRAPAEEGPAEAAEDRHQGAFWRATVICLTNPKSVLFFGSIFSAYMGPDSPLWVRGGAVAVVVSTCILWYAAVAWLFSTQRAAAGYARAQRPLDRTAAVLMGAFGLSLLWVFD